MADRIGQYADFVHIPPPCTKPPKGWKCTRFDGHTGPCAAIRVPWYQRLMNAVGEAIGNAKFGQ